jgi:hypothetical protein
LLAVAGRSYSVLQGDHVDQSVWRTFVEVAPALTNRLFETNVALPVGAAEQYYRVATPKLP